MASFDASKDEMQALSQQSEAVQRASAALSAAAARARGVRLCLVLTAVVLIGYICFIFYGMGMEIQSPQYLDGLAKASQKRLAANSDKYAAQFQRLVDKASPALTKAFTEQVKKDMPEFIKKAEKEKDTLAANLQEDFSKKVNTHYEKLLAQQESTLKEAFPEIKDPATHERMVKNFDKAMQRIVKKFYVDDFRHQIDEIVSTWDHFPEATAPKPGEPTLMDQFIPSLLQYLALKISTSGLTKYFETADKNRAWAPPERQIPNGKAVVSH
jgi:hypothetical protein